MSQKIELLSCPFCGDKYIRLLYHKSNGRNYYYWTIGCNTLNCVCLHTQGKMFKRMHIVFGSIETKFD